MSNPEPILDTEDNTEQSVLYEEPTAPLEGKALQEAILKQVEFYFSEQNLRKDFFLISQMDSNYYVPISTIAKFSKMRALTEDHSLIVESLKSSTVVKLSEDMTKIKPREGERKTVILYNLPSQTTEEEIENILKQGNFTEVSVSQDVNNTTMFVTFDNEDEALSGISFLRTQKIHDQVIRARVKAETPVHSLYVVESVPQVPVVYGMSYGSQVPGVPYWDPSMEYSRSYDNKDSHRGRSRNKRKDYRKGPFSDTKRRSNRKKGRDNKKSSNATLQLGPSHFPPLPSAKNETKPGYTEKFIKYSDEEIVETIQNLPTPSRPSGLESSQYTLTEPISTLEVLKVYDTNEELQDGVPPPKPPMSELIKAKQQSQGEPQPNNSPSEKKEKSSPQPKPAQQSNSPETQGKGKQQNSTKPEQPKTQQSNTRTWSQVVETEKENNSPSAEQRSPKQQQPKAQSSTSDQTSANNA